MRYIELFAGVGGFRLGIERAFQNQKDKTKPICVYTNEWNKFARQTYIKNFGGHIDERDITTVPTTDIPSHDLLVGGFPCQTFSQAGKRRGFDDTRGTLFFEIARILADKRPRHLVLENVKGLLSHDSGKTFQTIVGVLTGLGYNIQWQVLNSRHFGVPQNRERVFLVGSLREEPRPEVFPLAGTNGQNPRQVIWPNESTEPQAKVIDGPISKLSRISLQFQKQMPKRGGGDYAYTVDCSNSGAIKLGGTIRRLTPLECERLQGFPDNWTRGMSDKQRFSQMGNAVTVNVVEAVMRRLYEQYQKGGTNG